MSPPIVFINTFVQTQAKYTVDKITKFFIICSLILGVNRLPIISQKNTHTILSTLYAIAATCVINYFGFSEPDCNIYMGINFALHILCFFLGIAFWKRMRRYYAELCKFDICVGCQPTTVQGSGKLVFQTCIVCIFIALVFIIPNALSFMIKPTLFLLPMHIFVCFEINYYGHLLNLLIPRLRLINYYMRSSLTSMTETKESSIIKDVVFFKYYDKESNCQMKKLMDLYYLVVKSYTYLIDAIKWQLLFIIIVSFVSVLGFSYHFSLHVIRGKSVTDCLVTDLGLVLVVMIPLFVPCIYGDKVHNEVKHLRELLASRLYENKLDKSSRSIARALLAFTETRDLSFSLLRMLNIDISLPFKFVGLLVTYLIILLQFEKVINP